MNRRDMVMQNFDKYADYMNDRIKTDTEANRKSYAYITFKDSDGNPVKGAKIKAVQKSHDFKFGANLFMLDELETEEKNEKYKQYFKDTFNMATLPFYWNTLEPEQGKPRYDKNSPNVYRRPGFCKTHPYKTPHKRHFHHLDRTKDLFRSNRVRYCLCYTNFPHRFLWYRCRWYW